MKILFLDVDGVLNGEKDFANIAFTGEPDPLNPGSCLLLREVLNATGAFVVLSSTWRKDDGFLEDQGITTGWKKLLQKGVLTWQDLGQTLEFAYNFKTPILRSGHRGEEIQAWMDHWGEQVNLERFAIVDDGSDMLEEQLPFFVKTEFRTGLT